MTDTKRMIIPVALMAMLGLAACERSEPVANDTATQMDGMTDTNLGELYGADDMAAPTTQMFVERMASSNIFEIEASELAVKRATNPEVRKFAETMIADHRPALDELRQVAAKSRIAASPTMLDEAHNGMIQRLRAASKDDFDGVYADQQREAHEKAVELLETYATGGDNGDLRALAQKMLPKIRGHLDRIRLLDDAGADGVPAR